MAAAAATRLIKENRGGGGVSKLVGIRVVRPSGRVMAKQGAWKLRRY